MTHRIIGLSVLVALAGCNAPAPPPAPISTPQPTPVAPEPQPQPAPAEEPAPVPDKPKAHVDDPALVTKLRRQIAERNSLSSKVFAAGVAIDGASSAGTAFNEIHIPEHSCVVLGQLLGKADLVRVLEIRYAPDFETQTTENASDLRIMGNSLGNFATVAARILDMSHDERVVTWNLDCAGQLGLPRAFIKQDGQSSFYVVSDGGRSLKVLGSIERGFAQKIKDAIEANPTVEVVMLGSGGGYVDEAMAAGQYIS